jgi:REP element-mobilizing transposase RayT
MRATRQPFRNNAGPGWWFLTINAYQHREIFGQVVDGRMSLNEYGCIARDAWLEVPLHFPHVATDAWVVMPNHVHVIVRLLASDPRLESLSQKIECFGKPIAGSLATIVRSFKAATTRAVREQHQQCVLVWQPRFWERRLTDDRALRTARQYIDKNPSRWQGPWLPQSGMQEFALDREPGKRQRQSV